jgi:hypothetical protein
MEVSTLQIYSVPRQTSAPPIYLRDIRSGRKAIRFEGSIPVSINIQGHPLHFLTLNFSEIGMLLRCVSDYTSIRLRPNEVVRGSIGAHGPWQVQFTGEVVRCEETSEGRYYAVQILSSSCV